MNKPVTAQQLLDWIQVYLENLDPGIMDDEPRAILTACKAFLEALEEKP